MNNRVARALRELAPYTPKSLRQLKRAWNAMSRNAPRPGQSIYISVPIPDSPRQRLVRLRVPGRSIAAIRSAINMAQQAILARQEEEDA